jgi:hypothetical protein
VRACVCVAASVVVVRSTASSPAPVGEQGVILAKVHGYIKVRLDGSEEVGAETYAQQPCIPGAGDLSGGDVAASHSVVYLVGEELADSELGRGAIDRANTCFRRPSCQRHGGRQRRG